MQTNNIFSPGRFWLLLKEEFRLEYRRYLMAMGVIFGSLFIIWWFNGFEISQEEHLEDFHYVWFGILLLGGGALFSSVAFSRLTTKPARLFYLNLPASTYEKFASKWLITAILYPLVMWTVYLLFAWFINKVHFAYTQTPFTPLPAFGIITWLFIKIYLVAQTVFLLGAVIFHRYAIFKTIFSLLVLEITLAFFGYICLRILFPDMFEGWIAPGPPDRMYEFTDSFKTFVDTQLVGMLKKLFWLMLGPLMLLIGFFKLKEKEV